MGGMQIHGVFDSCGFREGLGGQTWSVANSSTITCTVGESFLQGLTLASPFGEIHTIGFTSFDHLRIVW